MDKLRAMGTLRRWGLVAGVAAAFSCATASAEAATVQVAGQQVQFTTNASDPESYSITAYFEPYSEYHFYAQQMGMLVVTAGPAVQAGAGCAPAPQPNLFICNRAGVTGVGITLGSGDDKVTPSGSLPASNFLPVTVDGGAGDDLLHAGHIEAGAWDITGGAGSDSINGSAVNDRIDIQDGEPDVIQDCYTGVDHVIADKKDTVPDDCERVDEDGGNSPGGETGVSIDDGAVYTNDPRVTLSLRWPRLASKAVISNDGGFQPSETMEVKERVSWTLQSSGPERLPKTVYVRFKGGSSGSETYTDDIILDETNPDLNSAKLEGSVLRSAAETFSRNGVTLRIKAEDQTSGVKKMQVTPKKSKPGKWRRFKARSRVRAGKDLFVRVRDGAGNTSRWVRAH